MTFYRYKSSLKFKKSSISIVKHSLILFGLLCTWLTISLMENSNGTEVLFLLPLSFLTIIIFVRPSTLSYAKDSFGLLILYAIIVLRYLVTPALIGLSGSLVRNLSTSPEAIRFAVFMMIVELMTIVVSIHLVWKPKTHTKVLNKNTKRFSMTWLGLSINIFLLLVIMYRGTFVGIIENLSFGTNFNYGGPNLKTYDILAFLVIKSFFFLVILSWLSKKYILAKSNLSRNIILLIAIMVTLLNALIYEGDNRAQMVMTAISSLAVLIYLFGKRIKILIPAFAILGFLFVWTLFSHGTLGVENTSDFFSTDNYMYELSRVAELYSNGVSTMAHSFDMYYQVIEKVNIETYVSELIKSNNIFALPGFWIVRFAIDEIPSFQNLFNQTLQAGDAFILPNFGIAIYSFGQYFGIIINIIIHFIIVLFIHNLYTIRKKSNDISMIYLCTYCEMVFAFVLMNNLMIAVSLLTAVPLLLYVVLKLNNINKYFQKII